MKITNIHLKDFHQFEDLTIDLTYPKGHEKAGQPLEKVCFIGQSGTGKTTLLKILAAQTGRKFLTKGLVSEFGEAILGKVTSHIIEGELSYNHNLDKSQEDGTVDEICRYFDSASLRGEEVSEEMYNEYLDAYENEYKLEMIFFPADLRLELNYEGSNEDVIMGKTADFRIDSIGRIWQGVFQDVKKYQEEEVRKKQKIADLVVDTPKLDLGAIQTELNDFEIWKQSSLDPISKIADECLDRILHPLHLRVTREFKFDSKDDIGAIQIEDMNGNGIPYDLLSTGTKQILLTAIPLYYLKPDRSLIICDEPERSLYPSFQKIIIDFYSSLATDCQFFYATHSPIIASCFEPWEIVELKFNENGKVVQDLYYPEGVERHVDNYTVIPSYLTYDLMLKKVFDLENTYPQERAEKVAEVLMLRNQLKQLKSEGKMKTPKAKEIYKAYKDLAGKLFWEFEIQ